MLIKRHSKFTGKQLANSGFIQVMKNLKNKPLFEKVTKKVMKSKKSPKNQDDLYSFCLAFSNFTPSLTDASCNHKLQHARSCCLLSIPSFYVCFGVNIFDLEYPCPFLHSPLS